MVLQLEWILPLVVGMGALLDVTLVLVYMRFAHAWKDIIFSKEKEETPDSDSGSEVYLHISFYTKVLASTASDI